MVISAGPPVVRIALESRATSPAAARDDATLAAQAGMDALLLAATPDPAAAALPFELSDFEGARDAAPSVLEAVAEAVAAVRAAGLAAAVAATLPETLTRVDAGGDVAVYVPSAALTDLPWLQRVADTGVSLWLGVGMSTLAEIDEAVATLVGARARLTLVHGLETGSARPDELNLRAITTLHERFGVPVGFRAGDAAGAACVAAVACGARLVIVPAQASLETLVRDLRYAADALGDGVKRPQASEWPLRDRRQRSLVARVAIARGQVIGPDMLGTAPPGLGLKPRTLTAVVGRRAIADIPAGTLLTLGMLD